MDTGGLAAIGGFLAGLITAIAGAIVYIMREKSKLNNEDRSITRSERGDTILQYKEISDRQEEQISRLDEQIQRQQGAISRMYVALGECRESEATMYGHLQFLQDIAYRHSTALRELGKQVDLPPPLPHKASRSQPNEEFDVRTTAQDSALLQKVSNELNKSVQESQPLLPPPLPSKSDSNSGNRKGE